MGLLRPTSDPGNPEGILFPIFALLFLVLFVLLATPAFLFQFLPAHSSPGTEPAASALEAVERWRPLAERAAARAGVEAALVLAVMAAESGGNPLALNVNPDGSVDAGLMQINSANWAAMGLADDPFDPEKNVTAGALMLADGLKEFRGDVVKALAAYNAGKGAVRAGRIPEVTLTRYVPQVLGYLATLAGNAPQR